MSHDRRFGTQVNLHLDSRRAILLDAYAAREGCTKTEAARQIVNRFLDSSVPAKTEDAA